MDVIYGLMPAMIILGLVSVGVFFWAVKNGQYEDMDGAAHRILNDDDMKPQSEGKKSPEKPGKSEK